MLAPIRKRGYLPGRSETERIFGMSLVSKEIDARECYRFKERDLEVAATKLAMEL